MTPAGADHPPVERPPWLTGEPGSVSHGTMRRQDLIMRFIEALDQLLNVALVIPFDQHHRYHAGHNLWVEQAQTRLGEIEGREAMPGYYESEDAEWDLEWLFEVLDECSPEGCAFGAHEGDGSDYGWWPVERDEDEDEWAGAGGDATPFAARDDSGVEIDDALGWMDAL